MLEGGVKKKRRKGEKRGRKEIGRGGKNQKNKTKAETKRMSLDLIHANLHDAINSIEYMNAKQAIKWFSILSPGGAGVDSSRSCLRVL